MTNFLDNQEGLRLKSYQDRAGKWTIGYGSTMYTTGKRVGSGETITKEQAEEIRDWEINNKSIAIKGLLGPAKVNANQMEALVSLTYNIGVGGLSSSSLLKIIRKDPNDKTMIPISAVSEINITDWMVKNNLTEINRIKMAFMLWNKITDPKTKKLVFDKGLFARRIREADLYLS